MESVLLSPEVISLEKFNETIKICNGEPHDADTLISQKITMLIKQYGEISDELYKALKNKINKETHIDDMIKGIIKYKTSISKLDKESKKDIIKELLTPTKSHENLKFYKELKKLLPDTPHYIVDNFNDLLTDNIKIWNAKCYKP